MPRNTIGRALLVALVALAAGPAWARAHHSPMRGYAPGPHAHFHRHPPRRALPPEVRYRDPRYLPAPVRRPRFAAPPTDLIQAYLPRHTDLPMYNEPPSRFPQR